jgi:hypothetical protein
MKRPETGRSEDTGKYECGDASIDALGHSALPGAKFAIESWSRIFPFQAYLRIA